jgi:hypothetical protein
MSFSQEIQFKIAVDSSQAAAGFQKMTGMAQQAGQKMDAAMSGNIAAARKLNDLKTQTLFNEMNTSEKIKSVTNDIVSLSKTKNALEEGSTKHLQVQYAILQKQNQLKSLYNKQTQEGQIGTGGAESGGFGETSLASLVAGGMFKRLIFMGAGAIMNAVMQAAPAIFAQKLKRDEEAGQVVESQISQRQQYSIIKGGSAAELSVALEKERANKEDIQKLEQEIKDYEQSSFLGVPFGFAQEANPMVKAQYEKLQEQLVKLRIEQDGYNYSVELTQRARQRETGLLSAEERNVRSLSNAQKENMLSAVEAARIKLEKARDVVDTLEGKTGLRMFVGGEQVGRLKPTGTPEEIRAAKIERSEAQAALRAAQMAMEQRQIDVSQTLTEQAAAGRTFPNGKPRPLSETERLARQAAKARQQARDAVLTSSAFSDEDFAKDPKRIAQQKALDERLGKAKSEAEYQQIRALGLEANVADRLSSAGVGMPRRITTDNTAMAADISSARQLLSAIESHLKPTVN